MSTSSDGPAAGLEIPGTTPAAASHNHGSFRQQLHHLLTLRERSQLKEALQIYAEKRYELLLQSATVLVLPQFSQYRSRQQIDHASSCARRSVQHLLEDLVVILDTPAKQRLWFYIIPLLSPHHQSFCQKQLGLPEHVVKSPPGRCKTVAERVSFIWFILKEW